METLKITKKDLDENNFYNKDSLVFDGHIEFEQDIRIVKVRKEIRATGYIFAATGTGINAGEGIKAGWDIKAGKDINAGEGINAGWDIKAGKGINAGEGIITFLLGGIAAKWISALRIAAGFNISEEQTISAKIRKGKVLLGKVKEQGK